MTIDDMKLIVRTALQRSLGALVCAVIAFGLGVTAHGQTPWETAPARPAALPPAVSPTETKTRVVSLSPPPVQARPVGKVQTPGFVPVQNTKQQQAAPSLIPDISLIPGGLGLPSAPSGKIPSQTTNPGQLSFPPLPSMPSVQRAATEPGIANGRAATKSALVAFEQSEPSRTVPEQFAAGKLIAVVGAEHILAGDMAVFVEPIVDQNRELLRSKKDEVRLRTEIMRKVLPQYIEVKALYLEFFRDMVGVALPKETAEMMKNVTTRARKIFHEKQVPNLLKKYEANGLADLEEKLRTKSMSLATLESQFVEQVLSQELERKYIPNKYEISRASLLAAYNKDRNEWAVPAKARWRQLTVRFDKHNQDHAIADSLIKKLGNEVFFGGNFEAVAMQSSEGYTSKDGGVYDWTTQGSLKSKPLDQAIFSLPLKQMSRVIEDDIGMHIIEVLERVEGHTRDFTLAQSEIRKRLSNDRRAEERKKFRDKILARTPIWTLWPDDLKPRIKHARPLSDALGDDSDGA